MTSTTPESPSLAADGQSESKAKGTRHRPDGRQAKEQAFLNLDIWRNHLIRRYQHTFLDHLAEHGESIAPDVTDDFDVPAGIRLVFTGTAISELARRRLIRKTGSPRYTTQNGRHGQYVEVWRLVADRAVVESWKTSQPVPPEPDHETTP